MIPTAPPSAEPTLVPTGAPSLHPTSQPSLVPSALPSPVPSLVPTPFPSVVRDPDHEFDFRGCTGTVVRDAFNASIDATLWYGAYCSEYGVEFGKLPTSQPTKSPYVDITPWQFGGSFTMEVMFKADTAQAEDLLIYMGDASNSDMVTVRFDDTSDGMYLQLTDTNKANEYTLESSSMYSPHEWVHLVSVVEGTSMSMYRDGNLSGSASNVVEPNWVTRANHYINHGYRSRYWNGTVSFVRIWHGLALNAEQVAELYEARIDPTPVPTLVPSPVPTLAPTLAPTALPTALPTLVPSAVPSLEPSAVPSAEPSLEPSAVPSTVPSPVPSPRPTPLPSAIPTSVPSLGPTSVPTLVPTTTPSQLPTLGPSGVPTLSPPVVEDLSIASSTAQGSSSEFNPSSKLTLQATWTSSDPSTTVKWESDDVSLVYGETTATTTGKIMPISQP